jgi:alpha-galactosidase
MTSCSRIADEGQVANTKIACLGGGSLYFPRVLADLSLADELSGYEIVLYDIDSEKTQLMAALGSRLAQASGTGLRVRSTADLDDALDGAGFAVSSIGGSGAEVTRNVYDSYYHSADMHIPAKYGIHQVIGDTAGPAGMMMGLRSIPAYLQICKRMEKRCPHAILLNHSNPMAAIMRALHKYSPITSIGICHGVQGGIGAAAELLGVPADELECRWIGTNHYYWFTTLRHKGQDLLPELLRRTADADTPPAHQMSADLSAAYGHRIVYPDDGHIIEFYPFAARVPDQASLPYTLAESARSHGYDAAESMLDQEPASPEIRAEFLTEYGRILDKVQLPEQKEDGIHGEGLATLIGAMATGRRQVCILNLANGSAIPNLPATAEVEVEAVTDSTGARALTMGDAPQVLKGILEKRFVWHELVADAGVKGDRNAALQALLIDEMAIPPREATAMLDELLASSADLLPQFSTGS